MGLPAEVLTAGRHNAARTGIDQDDALSLTAEAWASHPEAWRTVAHRRCIDERRRVSGDSRRNGGQDRRALVILDETFSDGELRHDVAILDAGLDAVEVRADLVDIVGQLPDKDVATLARVYWLGMQPEYQGRSAVERAKRHASAQAVAEAIRERKSFAIVPPPTPGDCPLSARELEVVAALADGLAVSEIAARLHLSGNTVKTHLRRIAKRLDTANATHAVAVALRAGWLT